jgi:hypothetical protein
MIQIIARVSIFDAFFNSSAMYAAASPANKGVEIRDHIDKTVNSD